MTKLTAKQQESFYNLLIAHLTNDGNLTSAYFKLTDSMATKFESVGLVEFIDCDKSERESFKTSINGVKVYQVAKMSQAGLDLAESLFGDFSSVLKERREYNKDRNTCGRCEGKGSLREYAHVAKGVCFACNGTGKRS